MPRFQIDIVCPHCGGTLRVIACIEDPKVIAKILAHIVARDADHAPGQPRAPPQRSVGLGSPSYEQLPFLVRSRPT
ncbi:MAG: hypothetical protein V3S34_06440 [Hyphomicrobium sp.]